MKIAAAFVCFLAAQPVVAFMGANSKTSSQTAVFGLPPKTGDNKELQNIFYQNQAWKAEKMAEDPEFFNKLGTTHTPEFMWIGCADARVPPNVIMGEEAGNVFVHRNVANMVVNTDTNLLSALQYGVAYLKVKHIIICGHYECGGVRAAEANQDFIAPLEMWLRNIRDVYAKHAKELDAISDANKRHRRLVDLNVVQQAINVMKTGVVQQRRAETYQEGEPYTAPLVHAMVFDPTSGDLKRIEIDFSLWENELTSVYGLHMIG